MSDSVDRVFAHALNTVKRIPRTGSARPPLADRLRLYGLYKQCTEGDVEGITARPKGDTEEIRSDQEKWDAWNDQKGMSKTEAKRQYISTLIGTMHRYASQTRDARELVSELEFVWDQIKSNPPSSSSSNSYPQQQGSGESPDSNQHRPIYPVMSEDGARNPGPRNSKPLRPMDPISQTSSDEAEELIDEEEPNEQAREQFVDAQDSQLDGSAEHNGDSRQPPAQPGRNFSRDARAIIAPISNYLNSQRRRDTSKGAEDANSKWQRRVESALIKMNAELAALREQLDMQQDAAMHSGSSILPPFPRNRRQGFFGSAFAFLYSTVSSVVKHIVADAVIIALITLWMRYKGIPVERLERIVVGWISSVRRLTLVKQVEKQVARSELKVPPSVVRSMPFQMARSPAAG